MKIKSYIKNINFTWTVIKDWFWSDYSRVDVDYLFSQVMGRFGTFVRTRGEIDAVRDMKNSRLAFTRWLAGRPFKPGSKVGVPIAPDGLPKVLPGKVRRELKRSRDPRLVKLVMTLLTISRGVLGGTKVDLEPIVTPAKVESLPHVAEVIFALRRLKVKTNQDLSQAKVKFNWISTAGPNGVSIATSLSDLALFVFNLGWEAKILLPALEPMIELLTHWESKIKLTRIMNLVYDSTKLRKLSVKDDKEGKSRVFAIFDYWSQTCLTPLHDYLFSILKSIREDCTFDQQSGISKIMKPSKLWYYSYDLKSATDRFPMSFQHKVLSIMTNPDYANAWRSMMVRLSFSLRGHPSPLAWGAGQPLGAKSSWAMFTLCHHVVVQIAAIRQGIKQPIYVILGDDIVLRGSKLAKEYRNIMHALGVEISDAKSHVSPDTFEFAKTWYSKGVNVSPFPISGFANLIGKPLEMANLIIHEAPNKGFDLLICPRSLSQIVSSTLQLFPKHERLAYYNANLLAEGIIILKWLYCRTDDWAINLCQMAGLSTEVHHNQLIEHCLSNRWRELVMKGLEDVRNFAFKLACRIPDALADFYSEDDDICFLSESTGLGLELAEHLKTIPLFAALASEYEREDELLNAMNRLGILPDRESLRGLELPPKPQLRGLKPIRPKANVRSLTKLLKSLKVTLRILDKVDSRKAGPYLFPRRKFKSKNKATGSLKKKRSPRNSGGNQC